MRVLGATSSGGRSEGEDAGADDDADDGEGFLT